MAVAAVASSNSNNGTSSPVGYASANSGSNNNLPLNNGTVTSKAKSGLLKRTKPKSDVGVQTDEDLSEEAGGFNAEPTSLRYDMILHRELKLTLVLYGYLYLKLLPIRLLITI